MSVSNESPNGSRERQVDCDEQRRRQSRALWRMSPAERVRAMWAGELSFFQLREWSSLCPDEVPTLGGEFAWIVFATPDWAEANERFATQAKG
jgi:hypothetical protein